MIGRVLLLSVVLLASSAPVFAADVTGNWRVTLSTHDGTLTGKASLKQTGESVTGWVRLAKTTQFQSQGQSKATSSPSRRTQPGRTVAFDECDLTVNDDKMVGNMDADKGEIEFARTSRQYNEPLRWPGKRF